MSYQPMGAGGPADAICHYGTSKLAFRGPQRALDKPYVACIGADETFGRFVERPFPAVLEQQLNRRCINLGGLFCGAEALCGDPILQELANKAELCIFQVPGVLGQTNRFYHVHPRRNDRFLCPTPNLMALYPEVDFTDIHFVRHLVARLKGCRDTRFDLVAEELRKNWQGKVLNFLRTVSTPVVLLWLDVDLGIVGCADKSTCNPVPVQPSMLRVLEAYSAGSIALHVQVSGASDELEDMLFGTLQQPMAERMIGPATHRRIA
ncbi:DUF6473 family protein, partial [Ruegeria sp.]|uniref:DUF6473 family protein n=1 Tax=Ruegeria sp. TaxID=1879320 RepID=UPI0023215735